MKIGSELQFKCPDECPETCVYKEDMGKYGQNSICGRCPVLCCKEPETDEDANYMPIVPADEYRDDWAAEWQTFFETGKVPKLYL